MRPEQMDRAAMMEIIKAKLLNTQEEIEFTRRLLEVYTQKEEFENRLKKAYEEHAKENLNAE